MCAFDADEYALTSSGGRWEVDFVSRFVHGVWGRLSKNEKIDD